MRASEERFAPEPLKTLVPLVGECLFEKMAHVVPVNRSRKEAAFPDTSIKVNSGPSKKIIRHVWKTSHLPCGDI
jgi:hypothetical protein